MSSCSSCGGAGNCSPTTRDRILLRGMLFHGYHGVFAEENKLGQKFLVDVDAWMDLRSAGRSDDIGKSVSYAELYEQIKVVVEGPPYKLVETVADMIAQAIFVAHPSITDVRVKEYCEGAVDICHEHQTSVFSPWNFIGIAYGSESIWRVMVPSP